MRHLTTEAAQLAASWRRDPARFVREAFPWGEPGPLQAESGPDNWQQDILTTIAEELSPQRALQIAFYAKLGDENRRLGFGALGLWPWCVEQRLP